MGVHDGLDEKIPVVLLSYHGKNHYNSVVDPAHPPPLGDGKEDAIRMRDITRGALPLGRKPSLREPAPPVPAVAPHPEQEGSAPPPSDHHHHGPSVAHPAPPPTDQMSLSQ
eukprot:TRINITY_DN16423_c0_g1_i1.p1 TRINITY_DN16423_c0_g1~~TRINITY_DN16423_c0_g1_i1.p1  ORF type:complete len:119 (-),score=48.42 TRINITY_DN16423_c0_g1_i1:82-414(-)